MKNETAAMPPTHTLQSLLQAGNGGNLNSEAGEALRLFILRLLPPCSSLPEEEPRRFERLRPEGEEGD